MFPPPSVAVPSGPTLPLLPASGGRRSPDRPVYLLSPQLQQQNIHSLTHTLKTVRSAAHTGLGVIYGFLWCWFGWRRVDG